MLRAVGRIVDALLSRGEGLDEVGDPYGPPLAPDETARLLADVREARGEFHAALDGDGARWAILAPPYGGIDARGRPGLYGMHVRALRRRGFAVALVTPPFHGTRAPPQGSGWGFVRADLGHTARTLAVAAREVASLARHLREERGAETLVGWGISLGGASIGLSAALAGSFDKVAFLAAVDSAASFYATGANRAARRRTLAAHGLGAKETEAAFAPFAPSSHPAPRAPRLWVVPRVDGVVPAPTQLAWRAAWGGDLVDLPRHGHGTAIADPLVARRIAGWLAAG